MFALLLGGGGITWWIIAGKVGGSSSPEAAAKKLFSSATSVDQLSLYGSLAPSEFAVFAPASQALFEAGNGSDKKSKQNLTGTLETLKNSVKVSTPTPLEVDTEQIVKGEVERVNFTAGVIKIDGDPKKIAKAVMELYNPIIDGQMSAWGGRMSKQERTRMLSDMEDRLERSLKEELPYTVDFSEIDTSVVTVREAAGWYVSPIMSYADSAHQASGNSDRLLGSKIVPPAKNSAKTAEQAAADLTEAIFAGDYDAIVEQMPLAERRLLSVYGESLADIMHIDLDDLGLDEATLDKSEYTADTNGNTARIAIERLTFSNSFESYWSSAITIQNIEISGNCITIESERNGSVDYYDYEHDDLEERWYDDDSYPYDYETLPAKNVYNDSRTSTYSDSSCLSDIELLDKLGVDDWAIIAVQEDGSWKVSPLATIADIAFIAISSLSKL